MWEVVIGDKQLAKIIFEQLLEVLSLTLPYQQRDFGGTVTRIETHTAKAVSSSSVVDIISLQVKRSCVSFLSLLFFFILLKVLY